MKKKVISILLAIMLAFTFAACGEKGNGDGGGGGGGGKTTVRFWYYGDETATDAYEAMVDEYNKTQGVTDNVKVTPTMKTEDGYTTAVSTAQSSKSGPDVYFAWDRYFKEWTAAGYTVNLQDYVDAAVADGSLDIEEIWTSTVDRYRYNVDLDLSDEDEDIYGLPVDTSPTALFYNKTAMQQVGVKVISVAEEDLAAWNAGGVEDKYGQTKESLGITVNVPKKGYFRNDANVYQGGEGKTTWIKPAAGTLLVFNDQIAMNWDEIEDLGFLLTKSYNSATTTRHGYYTEWWFNYGWSIGGDCVEDMSGNGSWAYSHGDYSANYIVNDGKTFTGYITGKEYQPGETLEFLDKVAVEDGDELYPNNLGGYLKGGSYDANGNYTGGTLLGGTWDGNLTSEQTIRDTVKNAVTDGTLTQLPSIREAFTRFARLAGRTDENGLAICPYPDSFNGVSIQYFTDGSLGMIVERGFQIPIVDEYVGNKFEWSTAPLPVYKKYANPTVATDDTVVARGKIAGHSESTALVIRAKSTVKDAAFKFIKWMVSDAAQQVKASYGFVPNQNTAEGRAAFLTALDPEGIHNAQVFLDASEYETPGDWWYMVNKNWIDVWANPLNSQVRYGKITLAKYFEQYIAGGNNEVFGYGNYGGDADGNGVKDAVIKKVVAE